MAGRVGVVLVLVWACWSGIGRVLANHSQCDVQALRCDVICAFPDLDLHCSRCIRRRPMRFGKRSEVLKTSSDGSLSEQQHDVLKVSSDGSLSEPHGVLKTSSDGSLSYPNGILKASSDELFTEPLNTRISSLGQARLHTIKRHDMKSTSASNTKQHTRPAEREKQPAVLLNAGLSHFVNKIWNHSIKKTVAPRHSRDSYNTDLLHGRYPHDQQDKLGLNSDDSVDMDFTTRRKRRSTSTFFDFIGISRRSNSGHGTKFPEAMRIKRSEAHEVVEGLMELLGLEELPVDPRIYGCHELLPVFD
ncbi:hypothetical protein OTU49_006890 [Cherax quadricarinatus]|uniref:Uncharacterized protein n=1 Tax=Cherax quadricarinatus TaxID=27406 RepID=A0AAW0WZL1_CHEQU